MPFSAEQGYVPVAMSEVLDAFRVDINTQFGTSYTSETFVGSNHYKFFYAIAQRVNLNEIKTSEIFLYLQQYIRITNIRISRPATTAPGIIEQLALAGYLASAKPPADAGKINIAVDVDETADDYADMKLEICNILKNSTVLGNPTYGSESETIVISNGQAFDYKYHLPNRMATLLRLTVTLSENNQVVIGSPDDTKLKLLANVNARYHLGLNFEPQKYFAISDAPWASQVLLEYSLDDGANWETEVYDADFDDLFDINLEDIELVEN